MPTSTRILHSPEFAKLKDTKNGKSNLQKVIHIIADVCFIVANVGKIRTITETSSNRLINKYNV